MKHAERELVAIREEVEQMWRLVLSQLEKSKQAFLENDHQLAREVISREKRVDAFELKIDSDCENYIALFNPVAIDLRLALSLIKISSTLERIADFCEGIARQVMDGDRKDIDEGVLAELQLEKMFDTVAGMLSASFNALETENTGLSGKILAEDEVVDKLYYDSVYVLTKWMQADPLRIEWGLKLFLLIRKLERIGDHCSNIVEEIVFYIDAKVLKHAHKRV